MSFDKILRRIRGLSDNLDVDVIKVAQKVIQGLYPGVETRTLDDLAAETAAGMATQDPDYALLAGRIAVSNLHKQTSADMADDLLPLLSEDVASFYTEHKAEIDAAFEFSRDMQLDFFGFKTLERSYLLRNDAGRVVERPQMLYMRNALALHTGDVARALETYHKTSEGWFTHATPIMFNAGTKNNFLISCLLLPVQSDSIEGIFETVKECALISKSAGGIGFSVGNVRCKGSRINSTGGTSSGLVPMLKVFDNTARYVDQGGGKRKGAFAAYLPPWHADIREFLDLKKNHGVEELRARDLFYGLWIPDLFMTRVKSNQMWSLFCPSKVDLNDVWGEEFCRRYEEYEKQGLAVSVLPAQELWFAILDAQIETGTPYMLYADACNGKSNQQNLGVIRCSNLCTEIVEFSSESEIASCNLSSVALPKFVTPLGGFDHLELYRVVKIITVNLNRVIDCSSYALEKAQRSNLRHRPIGIGVQGLADVFAMMRIAFDSEKAKVLNREIFETIYFASLDMSCELACEFGSYESFGGSPASQGILQYDMWKTSPSDRWDWDALKKRILFHGLRNSLLVAPMPTASTAQILGNNECFEPFTSNLYVRRVLAGEFAVVNKHLVRDLKSQSLWTPEVRQAIIAANGSVQGVDGIPDGIKAVYKTVWEMSMKTVIDMAADRGAFIDQSQSMNLFMANPTHSKLTSMHFYAHSKGLKTGMYYLRSRAAADPIKVTVPVEICKKEENAACESCSA